ncbi:MAG: hypothetical protein AAF544_05575, partial [Bacteroidota bacterium]
SIPAFCNAIEGLKEKLGACFIQLPPYFGVDRMVILEPGTNSLEGKWFAETFENALSWGNLLYDGRNFLICSIELSDSVYSGLFRLTNLDGIGPAVYAEITDLQYATITNFSIVK